MKARTAWIAGLLGLALATSARAQTGLDPLSGARGATAVASTAAGGTAVATAAPAQKTIFGFFGLSKANCLACRDALCRSQLGLMLNNLTSGPGSKFSAGLLPPFCPPLSPAAIAALPGGAQGAEAVAAKIKASEADAKARVAAVEYLGTVDCTHWPEAKKSLMFALRQDPNECVRFAAARVLNSGCCCSKEMIDALKVTVAGTDADGNAPETSPRVKSAAFTALQGCLMRIPEDLPAEAAPPPPPIQQERGRDVKPQVIKPETPSTSVSPRDDDGRMASYRPSLMAPSYDERLRRKTFSQTVEEAKRTLSDVSATATPPVALPPGRQSVMNALKKARQDTIRHNAPRATPPPARPETMTDPAVRPSSYTAPAPGMASAGDASDADRPPAREHGVMGKLFRRRGQDQ